MNFTVTIETNTGGVETFSVDADRVVHDRDCVTLYRGSAQSCVVSGHAFVSAIAVPPNPDT